MLSAVRSAGAIALGLAVLAGCAGSTTTKSATTTTSNAVAGTASGVAGTASAVDAPASAVAGPTSAVSLAGFAARFLAIAKPADRASVTANAAASRVFTQSQQAAVFAPLIAAEVACDQALLAVAWPTSLITTDVRVMVAATAALTADQRAVGSLPTTSQAAWITRTSADAAKAQSAVNIVRSDLGLTSAS
jgi:hypothetical protein